jgi:citrate lyase subunit beta/citryl-CoA lyase
MPGSNARALEKARRLPADSLILDLEDAVAPDAKALARDQVQRALAEGGYGAREVVVRVNGLDTHWAAEDIRVMARTSADALLFPKVETPDQVLEAIETLDSAGARPGMPVWIMAETPRCILGIDAVAGASTRLRVVVMGTSDLGKELRVRYTLDRAGLSTALSFCVLAARSHGLEILDGVHPNLQDPDGFKHVCQTGRELGFDGKTLIHPAQIETANRVFGPDPDELAQARRIVDAWAQASTERRGVVVVDGRMIESLHVEEARRSLALAEAIAALNVG